MPTQVGSVVFALTADIRQLQGQLRTMEGNFSSSFARVESLGAKVSKVFGALGIGLGVGAVVGFTKHLMDVGDQLSDLSDQTGHSIAILGGLKPLLDKTGSSVDAFAKSMNIAQRNLGEMDKETAEAIKELGLSVEELRKASPDEFVEKIANALAKVEDRNRRAALAFKLLGRSAAEQMPALLEVAEKGLPKLSEEAARGYAWLGRVKDRMDELTGSFLNFMAAAAGVAESALTTSDLGDVTGRERSALEGLIPKPPTSLPTPAAGGARGGAAGAGAGGTNRVRSPIDDTAKKALESFTEGLSRQADQLRLNIVELGAGKQASLELGLAFEFARFRANLLAQGKVVPADADAKFAALRDQILALAGGFEVAQRAAAKFEETVKMLDQDSAEFATMGQDIEEKILKPLREQTAELEKTLSASLLSESDRRIKAFKDEYDQRIEIIQRAVQQQIKTEAEGAALSLQALQDYNQQVSDATKQTVDEITEFERRAFERGFDALADITKDALNGQIKSWEDLGKRIHDVISEIVADYLTLQLKTLVLGPDFRKQGGQVGGLVGKLSDWITGTPAGGVGGGPELLGGGADATTAAIEATALAAQAGIQAESAAAQAVIQAMAATATAETSAMAATSQAGIQGTITVGTTSIEAVKAVAIAAIQAAAAAGSVAAPAGGAGNALLGFLPNPGPAYSEPDILSGTDWGRGLDVLFDAPVFGQGGKTSPGMPYIVGDLGPELFVPDVAGVVLPNEKLKEFGAMGDLIPRQHGGDILPAQRYLVGERGPEMFIPTNVAGRIEPMDKTAGDGRPIVVNVNVSTPDATSFKRSEGQITALASRAIRRATRNE